MLRLDEVALEGMGAPQAKWTSSLKVFSLSALSGHLNYSLSLLRLLVNLQTSLFGFLFQGPVFMASSSDGEGAVGLAMLINCAEPAREM
jgi:hypothetical protein